MIGTVHHKFHAFGDSTELSDDQFVANEVVEMGDMLFKLVGTIHVIVISLVADDNVRIFNHILDIAQARNLWIRESLVWIGSIHDCFLFEIT